MLIESGVRCAIGKTSRVWHHIRLFSRTAPACVLSVKDINEELIDLRTEFARPEGQDLDNKYSKDIERYIKNRQKAAEGEVKRSTLSTEKGAVVPEGDISATDANSLRLGSIRTQQLNPHPESLRDSNPMVVANLEDTRGWGARWQQGGTGTQRNGHLFQPRYSQGLGDRERYIGYLKTNPLQFYPNRSRSNDAALSATATAAGVAAATPLPRPVADHTRSWSKPSRLIDITLKKSKLQDYYSGYMDEVGNDRGRLQRWPAPEPVPVK
ncbi:hypothetical protein BV898_11524 [Hypsibius exemplaris]|uniref:Uncharacterized protein n=1 Tax=Hypsibius exemplaris TaxID=2072580 RepID=A0A1W0WGH0_HYPEX|nr:hypothetical protein BV898_11524 [Hypsibius exemplaris]